MSRSTARMPTLVVGQYAEGQQVVVKIVRPESHSYNSQNNSCTKQLDNFLGAVLKVTYAHRRNDVLQGAPQIMRTGTKQNCISRFLLRPHLIPGEFVWVVGAKSGRHQDRFFIMCYGLDDPDFETWERQETFQFPTPSRPVLGPTQPPIQQVQVFFSGSTSLSSPEVKNEWSCTPSSSIRLHSVNREKFIFHLSTATSALPCPCYSISGITISPIYHRRYVSQLQKQSSQKALFLSPP